MARARETYEITNNSDKEYKEEFKGAIVAIPPRGSIFMERRECVEFMGQYIPFDREQSQGLKPLSSRPAPGKAPTSTAAQVVEREPAFVNQATGNVHASKEALDAELAGFSHLKLREKED